MASKGTSSMPMTSMDLSFFFCMATTSSMLMKELPITTARLPSSAAEGELLSQIDR